MRCVGIGGFKIFSSFTSCVELLLSLVLQIPGESTSKPGKVVDTGTIGDHSQELSNRASQSWDGKSWKGRLTIVCSCVMHCHPAAVPSELYSPLVSSSM